MLLSSLTMRAALPFVLLFTAIDGALSTCSVYFYDGDHFRGSWWGAHANGVSKWANVWRHDVTSSMKVQGEPGCYAIVYEHGNFGGWAKRLDVGTYTKGQLAAKGVRNDAVSSVQVVNLCYMWSCTCQGMSDKYGTHHGVTWGHVEGQAEKAQMQAWWNQKGCNTAPTPLCNIWGCTCQGFSDTYGTDAGFSYADAETSNPGIWIGGWARHANNADLKWWWSHHKCNTHPTNRCSPHHCNGQWKLKSRGAKCNGACPVNTNYCCKIDGCDKVRVASIKYKESDIYVGQPVVKQLSAYTVDGENCGVSQDKPLDSFVLSRSVSITHDESLELGTSLEETFGWSQAQESTIEWSETASMSMDIPLGDAGLGMEHSMTKTWSKTSSFAQDGGVSKGKNTNKMTGRSKQVSETIEFQGISTAVPAYAWHRHKAYYHERPIHMTLTLNVQCIVNGQVQMTKEIPGTKLITATESHLKFEPMEDLTSMCKNTHSEYGTCKCFPGLRSSFHTATGCQARMKPDGTPSDKKGCYVYKDAGCTDNIGLKDADPSKYLGDKELTRKLSLDYPLDGSMFRWSYEPCNGGPEKAPAPAPAPGTCTLSSGWCTHAGGVKSMEDCDGDGILDNVCRDTNGGIWVAQSASNCAVSRSCPAGCAAGYTSNPGDIVGSGFNGNKAVKNCGECAQLCESKTECRSYECSTTELKCMLFKATMPTAVKHGDYNFCTKSDATCTLSSGWCKHEGATKSMEDCDGDGVLDNVCRDTNGGVWVAQSANNCAVARSCPGCTVQSPWCEHAGATRMMEDCDGDGIMDNVCRDTNGGVWVAQSASKCAEARKCAAEVSWKTVSGALGCPSSGCIKPSSSHGCKTDPKVHSGQCYWSSLTEAKARCGAWSECQAFWGPVDGKFFARGKGYTGPLAGYGAVTGYIEQAGRRRITADSNSLPAPLNF